MTSPIKLDLIDELNRMTPAAKHALLGTLLEEIITAVNAVSVPTQAESAGFNSAITKFNAVALAHNSATTALYGVLNSLTVKVNAIANFLSAASTTNTSAQFTAAVNSAASGAVSTVSITTLANSATTASSITVPSQSVTAMASLASRG
jgi:hypothetical protein